MHCHKLGKTLEKDVTGCGWRRNMHLLPFGNEAGIGPQDPGTGQAIVPHSSINLPVDLLDEIPFYESRLRAPKGGYPLKSSSSSKRECTILSRAPMKSGRERVHLAFDIICIDATKRMRNLGTMMKLSEAKNALGVDPEQY